MNNKLNYTYRGKHVFDLAMRLAFTTEYEKDKLKGVVGYKIHNNTMFLFDFYGESNKEDKDYVKLPYVMNLEQAISFVWGWFDGVSPNENKPDSDGDVVKGFTITTDGTDWRGGINFYHSFIAIKPTWIVYGK